MSLSIYDVVVAGGGIVGLTAALALAQTRQLKIAVVDSNAFSFAWNKSEYDARVSAVSLATKNIFQTLQVWESIVQKRVSPYTHMQVWDAEENGEIHFDCADVNESALGFIVEDNVMRTSLLERLRDFANVEFIAEQKISSIRREEKIHQREPLWTIQFVSAAREIKAKLLIGADGANSLIREQAGIELKSWDYEHTALIATVDTEFSHQRTAWQRFLTTGPLAFLPLVDEHACSIVWSTSSAHAQELLALNESEFCQALEAAFKSKLGAIKKTTARYHFPLRMRHAKNYVQSGLALIGDAAHTIHPLAGQGVNLGLLDAVFLAEVVYDAIKKNRDYTSLATLRRYERERKSDNAVMLAGVEVLKKLFSSKNNSIQQLRTWGLMMTNRTRLLKNFFINYALGYRGDFSKFVK